MNTEERKHWISWMATIAEGVAGVMAVEGGVPASQSVPDPGPSRRRHPLTETEKRIIEHQGTEPPFSGRFVSFFEQGTYVCRKCGEPLFRSEDKFDAGCGWPCFDDSLPGRGPEHPPELRTAHGNHLRPLRRPPGAPLQRRTDDSEKHALLRQFPFPGFPARAATGHRRAHVLRTGKERPGRTPGVPSGYSCRIPVSGQAFR